LEGLLKVDPDFQPARIELAKIYSLQSRHADALAEVDRVHTTPDWVSDSLRALVLARAGRHDEALRMVRGLEGRGSPIHLAAIWAALGDREKAFGVLGRACEQQAFPANNTMRVAPEFDALRADPRFAAIVRCAKLE